jgi:succinyl-diaminopimelate desuccinylase
MYEHNASLLPEDKTEIISVLSHIISIPSVKSDASPDAPYGIDTLRALEYMLSLGRQHGFTVKNLDGRAGYIEWGSGDKMIGLLCHLDVVPAGEGWSHDPFTLRKENGRLIGRGVVDDKGPAVIMFFAMLRMKNQGFVPTCRIRLILGLDEECGSTCMEHYVKVEELPFCGFTPDASFPAIFAEKGILQLRVKGAVSHSIRASAGERPNMVPARCHIMSLSDHLSIDESGVPAHASTPELGVNAIFAALSRMDPTDIKNEPLLSFLSQYIGDDTTGARLIGSTYYDTSGALTLNTGILLMDDHTSECILDIRYPISTDAAEIQSKIREKAAPMGLLVSIYQHQKPLYRNPEDPLIQSLLSVYDRHLDLIPFDVQTESDAHRMACIRPISPIAIGGGTYARSMPGLTAFGPSFPWEKVQAHQIDESIREDVFYDLVLLYEDAITTLSEKM